METIIEKRQLILRHYQVPASDYAMNHDISVLGLAPNAGKTEISIDVIGRYLLKRAKKENIDELLKELNDRDYYVKFII